LTGRVVLAGVGWGRMILAHMMLQPRVIAP
jgi:hypothetical protein